MCSVSSRDASGLIRELVNRLNFTVPAKPRKNELYVGSQIEALAPLPCLVLEPVGMGWFHLSFWGWNQPL